MLIDMFKTGLESSKANGNFPVVEIISLLKESFMEKRNSIEELASLVKSLKEIGIVKDNQEGKSPIEELMNYKDILERLGGLGGDVSARRTSPFVELIQVLGPFLPELISRITEPLNKFLDLKTMQMQASLSSSPKKFVPVKLSEKPVSGISSETTTYSGLKDTVTKEQSELLPISKELIDKGEEGYPEFYELLYTFPQMKPFLEAFRQGLMADTQIIDSMPKELPPEVINYLKDFLKWLRINIADMGTEVIGICAKCREIYDFASKNAFEEDDKICDVEMDGQICSGQIELKTEQPVTK